MEAQVQRNEDAAALHDGVVGREIQMTVGKQRRDPVSGRRTRAIERAGHRIDESPEVGVAQLETAAAHGDAPSAEPAGIPKKSPGVEASHAPS